MGTRRQSSGETEEIDSRRGGEVRGGQQRLQESRDTALGGGVLAQTATGAVESMGRSWESEVLVPVLPLTALLVARPVPSCPSR